MKWLFILLLGANVALFLWGWSEEKRTLRHHIRVVEPEIGHLQLLSEVPGQGATMAVEGGQPDDGIGEASPPLPQPPLPEQARVQPGVPEDTVESGVPSGSAPPGDGSRVDESARVAEVAPPPQPEPAATSPDMGQDEEATTTTAAPVDVQMPPTPPETPTAGAETGRPPAVVDGIPPAAAPAAEPAVARQCGVIGPFREEDAARQLIGRLVERQIEATLRSQQEEVITGYWVIIRPYATQREAVDAVRALREQGVEDLSRFYRGELKNGISLGVYRRERNAEQRRRQIEAKGFPAELLARRRMQPRFYIDYQGDEPDVVDLLRQLRPRMKGVGVEEHPCPALPRPG